MDLLRDSCILMRDLTCLAYIQRGIQWGKRRQGLRWREGGTLDEGFCAKAGVKTARSPSALMIGRMMPDAQ